MANLPQVLVLCHSILSFKLHWFYPTVNDQDVSSRLAPAFAFHIISMMIQNENDKHMSELTLRRQFIYPLIEMLHDTSMQTFQR
ncbi:hypothetical protein FOXYSP1_10907 [Fusarium oxysporum f. sp. phaseoli]